MNQLAPVTAMNQSGESRYIASWHDQTRLHYDPCARAAYDRQSIAPGTYQIGTPGYRWCESPSEYATNMTELAHQQKQYRNACNVNQESELQFSTLTNLRTINQLFTRPYLGAFMGAGQRSICNKGLETELLTGLDTRGGPRRACDVLSEVQIDRFQCLPEYGNPQRVQHIIEPWIRGGDNTRDYVRRINYEAKCRNAKLNNELNKKNL
jgi:hypothetical protein